MHDAQNQRREPVIVAGRVPDDAAHDGHVVVAEPAAERVHQQLARQRPHEHLGLPQDRLPQRDDTVDLGAIDKLSRRVDRRPFVSRAPGADRVEILERQSQRIHQLVAARARRACPVLLEALADRMRLRRRALLFERRYVGRRRGRRRAEQVVENPLAADDGRGPAGVRRDKQNRALAEQTFARVVGHGDATELAAVDVRHAVVPGQPLVDERVVGR